jgi:hypothetical protein
VAHAIERFVQRGHDAGVFQHIEGTAGALDGFLAPQHVGPARRHQHQVVKTHGFHGAGGGAHIAGVAGLDQDENGCAWNKSRRAGGPAEQTPLSLQARSLRACAPGSKSLRAPQPGVTAQSALTTTGRCALTAL